MVRYLIDKMRGMRENSGSSRENMGETMVLEKPASIKWQCGVLKDGTYVTFSPDMHMQGYVETEIDEEYEYHEYAIKPVELYRFMQEIKDQGNFFRGLSVGKPFKGSDGILRKKADGKFMFIDEIDEATELIGAANTIIIDRRNGKLFLKTTNTDYIGFTQAVEEMGGKFDGKNMMVFGEKGAARASIFGALKQGIKEVTVVSRNSDKKKERLEQLKNDFAKQGLEIKFIDIEDIKKNPKIMESDDIIVGATDSKLAVPVEGFLPKHVVVEWAYSKGVAQTALEIEASKIPGLIVVPGRNILIYQAVDQFREFTGIPAPVDTFKNAVAKGTV